MLVLVALVLCCGLCVIREEEVRQARQASYKEGKQYSEARARAS